ncbi:carboxylating nicotinate-nucleotide diphosphorylase [Beijerinckia mobilis]|uniref:carboxylating nicotinate-nucleotide diphosphorylase n=1 Tax=Beijerinckia mobilis TaxID=231434 RepID=UPI000557DF66|nr:carboxylating nicotinate-nucleotide diphosphorylase [Beijerinckia mobilis]
MTSTLHSIAELPRLLIEPLVRAALIEDLGRAGDITSDALIPAQQQTRMALNARQHGIVSGLAAAKIAFELIDPAIRIVVHKHDGARLAPGDVIAHVEGPARGILTAERVALNFLGHLSGVASATATLVAAVAFSKAKIVCTRKTTPGLRSLEKLAVRHGGGENHRFGLDDAMLIKDNHIALAGSVSEALRRAKKAAGHLVKIEIEVDTLTQLEEVLAEGVDAVLLDNMASDVLAEAVAMVAGRAITEASGRVTPETATMIAESGVDLISVGWLTHSASVLDIGLDFCA